MSLKQYLMCSAPMRKGKDSFQLIMRRKYYDNINAVARYCCGTGSRSTFISSNEDKAAAFIALLLVSFIVGLAVGMPPGEIIETIEAGMGGTLVFIAVIIGLGAMFGEMLRVSGGADALH